MDEEVWGSVTVPFHPIQWGWGQGSVQAIPVLPFQPWWTMSLQSALCTCDNVMLEHVWGLELQWREIVTLQHSIACIDYYGVYFSLNSKQTWFWPYMYVCVNPREEGRNQLYMTTHPVVPHPEILRTPLSLWIAHTLLLIQIQHLLSTPLDILLVLWFSSTGKDFLFSYSLLFKSFIVTSCVVLALH